MGLFTKKNAKPAFAQANVGEGTIVTPLSEKGFDVDLTPTVKVVGLHSGSVSISDDIGVDTVDTSSFVDRDNATASAIAEAVDKDLEARALTASDKTSDDVEKPSDKKGLASLFGKSATSTTPSGSSTTVIPGTSTIVNPSSPSSPSPVSSGVDADLGSFRATSVRANIMRDIRSFVRDKNITSLHELYEYTDNYRRSWSAVLDDGGYQAIQAYIEDRASKMLLKKAKTKTNNVKKA